MQPYLIISGDFVPWGGQDRAVFQLAWHLVSKRQIPVHIVAYRIAPPLLDHPLVHFHPVAKPLNSHTIGEYFLRWMGRQIAKSLAAEQPRVIVNGGNCNWDDTNWVHMVHAAYREAAKSGPLLFRCRQKWQGAKSRREELTSLRNADLIITNSIVSQKQIEAMLAPKTANVHVVYYGTDAAEFHPPTCDERTAARRKLGFSSDVPLICFIGGLGYERRKGFDLLFSAWQKLCAATSWDAELIVAGSGAELSYWQARAAEENLSKRCHFLGQTKLVPEILAGADALVSPTRYEAYGLGVQEALLCGLPAFVTEDAGVAERYPENLRAMGLLLPAPPTSEDIVSRLLHWRKHKADYRVPCIEFGAQLSEHTWAHMSESIIALMEATPKLRKMGSV